jgi:hypothetical protein
LSIKLKELAVVAEIKDFEKLGVFYLGKQVPETDNAEPASQPLLLYESKDLLTHGVCIGMTGSGKTGLCLGLIEEAAIDGIPVIAIDPKGDLSNLLLAFPKLLSSDFAPWVSEEEARREGISRDELAEKKATLWRDGLKAWGQDGERIARYKNSCDFSIYTPGSSAGLPVSILSSLKAPGDDVVNDGDSMREHVSNVVASLLTLLGIDADPLKSREHILLSTIIDRAWRDNKDIDLIGLVSEIQHPSGSKRIGALDLDTFFPQKERFAFALSLNNLLAAPGFDAWLSGYPLDIGAMLFNNQGKPQISIFSIAHLNDSERMFFVTLLLNQILTWMRSQTGSSSLRAILYMDEIYGYFPPVSNPPSKTPLLTLLKQARAYGLGILLASQNSVDLDYKGLANAGTWFIGRLQTERDKQRLLDGLEGAFGESGKVIDRRSMAELLGRLKTRNFLLNNIHSEHPQVFETRWTLSYLFGPLVRNQIKTLMAGRSKTQTEKTQIANNLAEEQAATAVKTVSPVHSDLSTTPLSLGQSAALRFLPVKDKTARNVVYKAAIFATTSIRFTDAKAKLDYVSSRSYILPVTDTLPAIAYANVRPVNVSFAELEETAVEQSLFDFPPSNLQTESNKKIWRKEFSAWLTTSQKIYLLKSVASNQFSQPLETEKDFRLRLRDHSRAARDESLQKLKAKYAPKLDALQTKIRAAQATVSNAQDAVSQYEQQAAVTFGGTVLGAILRGKPFSASSVGRAQTAAKEYGKARSKEKSAQRAQENLAHFQAEYQTLDADFRMEMNELSAKFDPAVETFEIQAFTSKSSQISISVFEPVWVPFGEKNPGQFEEIWR